MLRYVVSRIGVYTGLNMPLENFAHDVRNGKVLPDNSVMPAYITALFWKLKGPARDHVYYCTFETDENFLDHWKNIFEPELEIPPSH